MREDYFENAFPESGPIFKNDPDATILDFIDPEKLFLVVRRALLTYDVLVQPEIRELVIHIGAGSVIRPYVNLSKKEAEIIQSHLKRDFAGLTETICEHLEDDKVKEISRRIFWGSYQVLIQNRRSDVNLREPYYVERRRGWKIGPNRYFAKLNS